MSIEIITKMKEIEEKYGDIVKDILMTPEILQKVVTVEKATEYEDMKLGIDFKFKFNGDTIAKRVIENPEMWKKYHQIIIRYSSLRCSYVEYQKIIEGKCAKYYLYIWIGVNGKPIAWMFIDIDKLKMTIEFVEAILHPNFFSDGGSYVAIHVKDLAKSDCIIACNDEVRNYLFSKLRE